MTPAKRALRSLSTILIISGVLMLADAGLTLVWQEPVSAVYAKILQGGLGDDLRELELAKPSRLDLAALRKLATEKRRMAFLARRLRSDLDRGAAAGRWRSSRSPCPTVTTKSCSGWSSARIRSRVRAAEWR